MTGDEDIVDVECEDGEPGTDELESGSTEIAIKEWELAEDPRRIEAWATDLPPLESEDPRQLEAGPQRHSTSDAAPAARGGGGGGGGGGRMSRRERRQAKKAAAGGGSTTIFGFTVFGGNVKGVDLSGNKAVDLSGNKVVDLSGRGKKATPSSRRSGRSQAARDRRNNRRQRG